VRKNSRTGNHGLSEVEEICSGIVESGKFGDLRAPNLGMEAARLRCRPHHARTDFWNATTRSYKPAFSFL